MKTHGQVLLDEATGSFTEAEIAEMCGVSQATISLWLNGGRKPSYPNRKVLFEQLDIDMDAWDVTAEGA
jgi:transcriptional regulator with XRE-family HTH domain